LIFYRKSENDVCQFIGKYNLNLDKATPKPFGFNHDDTFGWLSEGDKYYKVQYASKDEKYKNPWVG